MIRRKLSTTDFVNQAHSIHKNKYQYPDEYIGTYTKIRIICPIHGEFFQYPNFHINRKCGCPKCKSNKWTTDEFIKRAIMVHGNKFQYPDEYTGINNKIRIICPIHGEFFQTPNIHVIQRHGCDNCSTERLKLSTTDFVQMSTNIHNNKYQYPDEYLGSHTKIRIICPTHGEFFQLPTNHLQGQSCPACYSGFSKMSIDWLESIMEQENIHIQHALNGGEYQIPGTRYKADGYCKETNTVYEFHGDRFHGNPIIFHPLEPCHPFDANITAGELYQKTVEKESIIKRLGYKLVVKWETI